MLVNEELTRRIHLARNHYCGNYSCVCFDPKKSSEFKFGFDIKFDDEYDDDKSDDNSDEYDEDNVSYPDLMCFSHLFQRKNDDPISVLHTTKPKPAFKPSEGWYDHYNQKSDGWYTIKEDRENSVIDKNLLDPLQNRIYFDVKAFDLIWVMFDGRCVNNKKVREVVKYTDKVPNYFD